MRFVRCWTKKKPCGCRRNVNLLHNNAVFRLIVLAVIQALFLAGGQVLLKYAMAAMPSFAWSWTFFRAVLINWQLACCGISFTVAGLLWMYILRHYPFSQAYPLSSLAYVFGMVAAMLCFHEHIAWTQWAGILLIMAGCYMVVH